MNLKELFLWWVDFVPKKEHIEHAKVITSENIDIDTELFYQNLRVTQNYCRGAKGGKDLARMYRSINPVVDGKPLFRFNEAYFEDDIAPGLRHCIRTEWAIEHWEPEAFMDTLFDQQLEIKYSLQGTDEEVEVEGDILLSFFDEAIPDGISEIHSLGLIDLNDMPPIDTWFYMVKTQKHGRILFSWIPQNVRHYANEGVLVNMLGCINWFEKEYPETYKTIMK